MGGATPLPVGGISGEALPRRRALAFERLAPCAGPVLIVASVLMVLREVAFGGMLTAGHPDVLTQWLPVHCFLGKSLAAGNLPQWNPYVMGGIPFAADPQSGWMYLPAMTLYAALPCAAAARWFIVLQPLIAGLGLYAFLRSEGAARTGATAGGLVLALAVSSSRLAFSLPFSGTLAWSAVALACASRAFRAAERRAFLAWTAAAAISWGQIAGAHLSHGLAVGTLALAALLVARAPSLRRIVVFVAALPLVNAAVLLPRLAYLPRTTMGLGYERLDGFGTVLPGAEVSSAAPAWTATAHWLGTLATVPGVYLGAAALLLSVAAFRRGRSAWVFGGFGATCYLLSIGALIPVAGWLPFGDFYLHAPARFSVGVVLALAILAGLGVGRVTPRVSLAAAAVWTGAALWAAWGEPAALALPLAGGAACALLLRNGRGALVPAVLSLELMVVGLFGAGAAPLNAKPAALGPRPRADVDAADYVRRGRIASALSRGDGRYLSHDPSRFTWRDYRGARRRGDWGLLANQRSVIFALEEAQGYNPVQLVRYWTFVRAAAGAQLKYNAAGFLEPSRAALDVLQVNWIVAPSGARPPDARRAVVDGKWALFRRRDAVPRVSLHTRWTVADSAEDALARVLSSEMPGAVVETGPRTVQASTAPPGSAVYRRVSDRAARVKVEADAPSLLVVRNTYDAHWTAEIDGRPAKVVPAQYLAQGVFVPAGRHEVELSYNDPSIGAGLAASAAAVMALVAWAAWPGAAKRRYDPGR